MDQAIARNEYAIVDGDVTSKQRAVGDDNVITEPDIMAQMAMGHQKVVRPNYGCFGRVRGSVNGDVFAKNIALADAQAGRFAGILGILRRLAQDRASVDLIGGANGRYPCNMHVPADAAVRPNRYSFINDRVRANYNRRVDLRLQMDDRGLMNHE